MHGDNLRSVEEHIRRLSVSSPSDAAAESFVLSFCVALWSLTKVTSVSLTIVVFHRIISKQLHIQTSETGRRDRFETYESLSVKRLMYLLLFYNL